MSASRIFFASIEQLPEMMQFIREEALKVGFDKSSLNKIEVASEEALVNIIQHSYESRGGEIEIVILSEPQKKISITLSDTGEAFDPNAQELPDTSAPLDARAIGGLGLLFIRALIDQVSYQRKGEWNILTLEKHFREQSYNNRNK